MGRWVAIAVVAAGWVLLAAAVLAPLAGILVGLTRPGQSSGYVYGVPGPGALLVRSVTLSAVATLGAVLLGLMPAAVLGSVRGRRLAIVTGLVLAPLLIPPQVYVYAWQIALAPQALLGKLVRPAPGAPWVGGAVKAGLISAAWLWPVVALIVAAGWRSAGQAVYAMALLDTTPRRAFFRAVLPSLRPQVLAAGLLVFAVTLTEYAIPHLSLAEVYPTCLQVLIDAWAPPRQVLLMAGQAWALVLAAVALGALSLRGVSGWQAVEGDESGESPLWRRPGRGLWLGAAAVWLVSVALPAAVMLAWLRVPGKWKEGFLLFQREWLVSLLVSLAAGVLVVMVAMMTALLRTAAENRRQRFAPTLGMLLVMLAAMIPPTAMGKGFVLIYNRRGPLGDMYEYSPSVWILGLVARYAAIAVVIVWLAVGRRGHVLADQARADGADRFGLLAWVLAPAVWPSLLAAGLIVTLLSMFEVVTSQMLSPVQFSGVAMSILNQMHYGQDDMVITTSLMVMVAGILLTQACGWLLAWRRD
jgi:iron(III) transport system permease protein